jgi:hypothetical protein
VVKVLGGKGVVPDKPRDAAKPENQRNNSLYPARLYVVLPGGGNQPNLTENKVPTSDQESILNVKNGIL